MDTIGFVFGMAGMTFGLLGFIFGASATNQATAANGRIEHLETCLRNAGVLTGEDASSHRDGSHRH